MTHDEIAERIYAAFFSIPYDNAENLNTVFKQQANPIAGKQAIQGRLINIGFSADRAEEIYQEADTLFYKTGFEQIKQDVQNDAAPGTKVSPVWLGTSANEKAPFNTELLIEPSTYTGFIEALGKMANTLAFEIESVQTQPANTNTEESNISLQGLLPA